MNKINMLKAVYFLYTQVPEERFDMQHYRKYYKNENPDNRNPICTTVGCAAGWLTAIIPKEKIIRGFHKSILFDDTLRFVLNITHMQNVFLFAGNWSFSDNTLEGACKRFLYLLITENPDLEIKTDHPYHQIDIVSTYNKLKQLYGK